MSRKKLAEAVSSLKGKKQHKTFDRADRRKTIKEMYIAGQGTKRIVAPEVAKARAEGVKQSSKYGAAGATGMSAGGAVGDALRQPDTYNYIFQEGNGQGGDQATENDLINTTTVNPVLVNDNGIWKFRN